MDPATQGKLRNRLRRVRGQVQGVERMLEESKDCVALLLQLSAIQGALTRVRQILLSHHVESCLVDAFERGDAAERAATIDELLDVVVRHGAR